MTASTDRGAGIHVGTRPLTFSPSRSQMSLSSPKPKVLFSASLSGLTKAFRKGRRANEWGKKGEMQDRTLGNWLRQRERDGERERTHIRFNGSLHLTKWVFLPPCDWWGCFYLGHSCQQSKFGCKRERDGGGEMEGVGERDRKRKRERESWGDPSSHPTQSKRGKNGQGSKGWREKKEREKT